jgi:hypothetical protein
MEALMTKQSTANVARMVPRINDHATAVATPTIVSGAGYKLAVEIITVTPDMAAGFLKNMVNNRRPKKQQVDKLGREMVGGNWLLSGEALIFDEEGMMLDGQHRCLGAVATGQAFVTLVVRGISRAAFDRLDSGAKRSAGDILGIKGVVHRDLVAAAVAMLIIHRDGGMWYNSPGTRHSAHVVAKSFSLFPGVEEMATVAQELNRVLGGKGSFWLVARYLTAQKDPDLSRAFFGRLVTGLGLDAGDPEHLLRSKLIVLRGRKFNLTYPELAAMTVNAWNARRKGRRLSQLRGLQGEAPVPQFI